MTSPVDRLTASLSDRYRVERELGQGGMATVYLAEDLKHSRKVAIKVLHPELSAVIGGDRFLTEIKVTANLQHPHILGLIDSGDADGLLYYVMPYVSGESLRTRLTRDKQLPIDDALRLSKEVASALDYAHRQGVVHRDIKPENVLLQDGSALVADFGIALAVQQAGGSRMTQTGMSLGTPAYMSPEQAMGERDIGARSDVYALGALTYEMLTGEPPFTGLNSQAIVAKVLTETPRPLRLARPNVRPAIEGAVLTALQKLPADRFGTAKDFAEALDGKGGHHTATVQLSSRPHVLTSSRPGRALALAAATALLVATATWALTRHGKTGAPNEMTVSSFLPPPGTAFAERLSLALSPDGRSIAFVAITSDGSRQLYLRHLDHYEAEPLEGTTGAGAPFWSPDGRSIGFFTPTNLVVRAVTGEVRARCPASVALSGSWGRDGVIVFSHRGGVGKVPAAGGNCETVVPRDSGAVAVSFLDDGRRFIYSRGSNRDAVVADLTGRQLATLPVQSAAVLFVSPDRLVASSGQDLRTLEVWHLDQASLILSPRSTRLTPGAVRTANSLATFSIVPAGNLAYLPGTADRPYFEYDASGQLRDTVRVEGTWSVATRPRTAGTAMVALAGRQAGLWIYDLDGDRATRLPRTDSLGPMFPAFSADGLRLAYTVVGSGQCGIAVREVSSGAERYVRLDSTPATLCPQVLGWSADGRQLLVRRDIDLQVLALDGAVIQDITRPGRLLEGRFSPDGRWLAFSSEETGRAEVYVQPLPTGAATRTSIEGGRWPAWSEDSRTLYYMAADGRIQAVAIEPGGNLGAPRTLFAVPTWRRSLVDDYATGFAVVGNGERFIIRQSPSALGVTLVQGWPLIVERAEEAASPAPRR